ncbi:MAG: helix-turn-helix domain-containing protein [Blautia sp.]
MNELEMVLIRDLNETVHYHPEIEIFFVVGGSAQITVKNRSYELEQEDIIVVNSGEVHSVESSMNSIVCDVRFSCRRVLELTGENMCIFECNSRADRSRPYSTIRTVMREVIYRYIKQEPGKTDCLKISALYKLLDCLIENYRDESVTLVSGHKLDDSARVQQIYQYVNQNYQYGINMSELADQLYLSTSTLSRVFKKETGIYFADYVSHVRMSHAVDELLQTEKSITMIAVDCGFSNPSVFNRSFKELYGVTPSDYRAQKKEQMRQQEEQKLLEQENLRKELTEQLEEQNINIAGRVKVSADVNQSRAFVNQWNDMMNIGSVDMLCRAAAQQQVLLLKKELGFKYARIWSIFSQKNMICTGKEGSDYNFSRLDYIFNFLIENDMIPFLDFGNRPDIAVGELNVSVFETHDYILFESRAAWEDCLLRLMEHLVEQFGEAEIGRWGFEFSSDQSNVPVSNYYTDDDYCYHNVFRYAWNTIKKFAPNAMVGGPMAIMDFDEQFVVEFLLYCREQKCVPDFVSLALFPYRTQKVDGRIISEPATTDNVEMEFISRMQKVLLATGCTNCRVFVTEWNNSVSNRNYLNDSNFRGAYIIHKMPDISESVDCVSLWMASDIISNYIDSNRVAYGGGGLLTQDGILKPAFYALQFMNQLGERLISKGENYIITKKHETSYYIICHNFKWYNCRYFKKRELLDDPKDIEGIFENMDPVEIVINLNNLPDDKKYIITRRCVAADYGNLLGEWKNFQYDEHLSADNIRYIRNASYPRMSMERKKAEKGSLRVSVTLQAHEFILLHIHEDKLRIR